MEEQTFLAEVQPLVFSQMKKSVEHERLAHAYLFEGEAGTGKDLMSKWLAKRLFCSDVKNNEPCNQCNNCRRIEADEHPNVQTIEPDGQTIKVEQIRRLQREFVKSGFEERLQIFIIRGAEKMNVSAANSLLKFLEEPQGSLVAILETAALGRILPTIQSRCQIVHFTPLNRKVLVEKLQEEKIGLETSELLASLTNSLTTAVELSQDEWFNETKEVVRKWYNYLEKKDWQAFVYVQKKISSLAKEKDKQLLILKILLHYVQKSRGSDNSRHSIAEINRVLELILQAQQKLGSNVAFQAVCEQLVIRIIK